MVGIESWTLLAMTNCLDIMIQYDTITGVAICELEELAINLPWKNMLNALPATSRRRQRT